MRNHHADSSIENSNELLGIGVKKTHEQVNERLENDHIILMMSIMNIPKCNCKDGADSCDASICKSWELCGVDIEEKLFNIMCASFDDFMDESAAMSEYNSVETLNYHSQQHCDLMADISDVMRRFDATKNRREAIMGFNKIAKMLDMHIKTSDMEMMARQRP